MAILRTFAVLTSLAVFVAVAPVGAAQEDQTATVVEVIDGDTIKVDFGGGSIQTVRYVGVDAPDLTGPGGAMCYAAESAERNSELVLGREVTLVQDVSDVDQEGRLLRYVYLDDLFINADLVLNGFAVAKPIEPDITNAEGFDESQVFAKSEGIGMWSACGG